jgi:peptidoglycan/xylan/chitin deacetylase (PgdA/CDA1 family)
LEALAAANVAATFFVLGERAQRHPELLARVRDGGHEVEVHGYAHLRHPQVTRAEVEADIDRALAVLGGATRWRIPWGHLADFTTAIAEERELEIVGWSTDTHDWRGDDARTMLAQLDLTQGGIVLAHDGISVGAQRSTADETARLVPLLVEAARRQGLEPGPLTNRWPVPIPIGNPEFHPGVVQPA